MKVTEISLLDVFHTGRICSVEIGASKEHVKASLGEPEDWLRNNSEDRGQPYSQAESLIWIYGGIEFYWGGPNDTLNEISFKPHYLYRSKWKTNLDCWIFRASKGPSLRRLKAALKQEAILFQDTGLEIFIPQHDSSGAYSYEVISFQKVSEDYDPLDVFGTLVLKSGVQVRYGEDNYIIKVSLGSNSWAVKGSEQLIHWE